MHNDEISFNLKGKCLGDFCSFGGKSAVIALIILDLYDVR